MSANQTPGACTRLPSVPIAEHWGYLTLNEEVEVIRLLSSDLCVIMHAADPRYNTSCRVNHYVCVCNIVIGKLSALS